MEGNGDKIKSKQASKRDRTLLYYAIFFIQQQQQQNDNVIPMPTLYNDSNESAPDGRGPRQPRMGTIEVLLYNMASMLAGVAVGYDVRLSNVSPIHPKLYPKRYVKLRFMIICAKLYIPSTLNTDYPQLIGRLFSPS